MSGRKNFETEKPDDKKAGSHGRDGQDIITIRKYSNRRLYNTQTSSYVTLEDLCALVRKGVTFRVVDAKTNQDLTRLILTQIILEEESKGGQGLLPINVLRQLIAFYGDSVNQMLVPRFLEEAFEAFSANQSQFQDLLTKSFNPMLAMKPLEELSRQNSEWFQNMLGFVPSALGQHHKQDAQAAAAGSEKANHPLDEIKSLQDQLEALKKRIDSGE